jgi:serine/threonine-protein kinase HipA
MKINTSSVNLLQVSLDFGNSPAIPVGRLASDGGKIYFEYDQDLLNTGLQISPYKLPLKPGTFSFETSLFDGLPGVFNDSLPDGWGRLLLDRLLRSNGILPEQFTALDRLAHVGKSALGALIYIPDNSEANAGNILDLDKISQQSTEVLRGESSTALEELISLNGSSAGARPKAMIGFNSLTNHVISSGDEIDANFEHYIVKFGNSTDGPDAGAIEYVYNQMAKKAGLYLTDYHLFNGKGNAGYFATKRFDRQPNNGRLHVLTACGLLHSDFRTPALDYEDLIKATLWLTKDISEAQKVFRYAVFNVLAHNRDDHSKNFSFLMDSKGAWKIAPAYDLTFSSGPRGHQSMLVAGEGESPTKKDLMNLAKYADLSEQGAKLIIDEVASALTQWPTLAMNSGVLKQSILEIGKRVGGK